MDGLRRYRSGRFGFQTPTSAGLFADSYGFLFVGGLLAGWTFSPHLASRYRMIREGLIGGKFAIGHSFKIRITTSVLSIAGSV